MEPVAEDSAIDDSFDSIDGHTWKDGVLMFNVRWMTDGDISSLPFSVVKRDFPSETAKYILTHRIANSTESYSTGGRYTRWARQFERQLRRIMRRLVVFSSTSHSVTESESSIRIATSLPDGSRLIRRSIRTTNWTAGVCHKRRKPGRISRPVQMKYGVVVPQSVRHALELDKESGVDVVWTQAIRKEVASLLALNCFEFFPPDYKPSPDHQFTKLSMIFEVKQDGRRKARLVAGGHMVDPMGINPRSTVVKGISVRLLDLIAHRDNLGVLCGDIGNAFITADCMEKVNSRTGPEFDDREGSMHSTGCARPVGHSERISLTFFTAWVSRLRDTTGMFGCAIEKSMMDTTTYALMWTILRSWPETPQDGKNRSLRHSFSSLLAPQLTTWEAITTIQRRNVRGC